MSTIKKRPGYSLMRETQNEEKGRELAKMMKTNPKAMRYFMKRNPFVRVGEIGEMVISTESHSRKEWLRSAFYNLAEPYLKDDKMRDVNIEGAVKGTLEAAKKEIMSKPVKTEDDLNCLKVIDEMLKKENEIDSSKILKDKEKWWRRILRFLTAAALGAALMLPFMSREGDIEPKVVEKRVEDPETKKSLEECLAALNNNKCPPSKVVYKKVSGNIDLDNVCSGRTGPLAQSLLTCENELSKLKDELARISALKGDNEKYAQLKVELMAKVDRIFNGIGLETENELYRKQIRPWFKSGIDKDDPVMIALVIEMGGELLVQKITDKKVVEISEPKSQKEFSDVFEEGNLAYLYGIAFDKNSGNRRDGMKKAAWEYYKVKYKLFQNVLNKFKNSDEENSDEDVLDR
ncbi:MAG: hypothetical protein QW500_00245 [Candidatus Micrarchaeia archaeon]